MSDSPNPGTSRDDNLGTADGDGCFFRLGECLAEWVRTLDPAEALRVAMAKTATSREQVADLCDAEFGVRRWADLTDLETGQPSPSKQWGLVLLVDPEVTGPYGHSMAPF